MNSDLTILTTKKLGAFRSSTCIVSFFPDEILLTSIDSKKKEALVEKIKTALRNSGAGRMKISMAGLAALPEYTESVRLMDRNMILKEDTSQIPKDSVRKMKFSEARERRGMDNASSTTDEGKLLIKLSDERLQFSHREEDTTGRISDYIRNWLS